MTMRILNTWLNDDNTFSTALDNLLTSHTTDPSTTPLTLHFFHITGFGSFAGIHDNPAKRAVELYAQTLVPITTSPQKTPNNADIIQKSPTEHSQLTSQESEKTSPTSQQNIQTLSTYDEENIKQNIPSQGNTNHIQCFFDCHVLKVDIISVEEYFIKLYDSLIDLSDALSPLSSPKEDTSTPFSVFHHFLHFGVHGGIDYIALEEIAYNQADFRVPDECGNKPQWFSVRTCPHRDNNKNEENKIEHTNNSDYNRHSLNNIYHTFCVDHKVKNVTKLLDLHTYSGRDGGEFPINLEFDSHMSTQYNLDMLCSTIIDKCDSKQKEPIFPQTKNYTNTPVINFKQLFRCTNNPGSFVCNYIYYVSLYYSSLFNLYQSNSHSGYRIQTSSLFFHVPPQEVLAPTYVADAIANTVSSIIELSQTEFNGFYKEHHNITLKTDNMCDFKGRMDELPSTAPPLRVKLFTNNRKNQKNMTVVENEKKSPAEIGMSSQNRLPSRRPPTKIPNTHHAQSNTHFSSFFYLLEKQHKTISHEKQSPYSDGTSHNDGSDYHSDKDEAENYQDIVAFIKK